MYHVGAGVYPPLRPSLEYLISWSALVRILGDWDIWTYIGFCPLYGHIDLLARLVIVGVGEVRLPHGLVMQN